MEPKPTPDEPLEPGQTDTPATEPVVAPTVAAVTDQSAADANDRLAQSEYTKAQQAFAVIRQELGLEGKPTRDQIVEAIRTLKEREDGTGEIEELDPRIDEANARAFAAELRVQEAIYAPLYGDGFSQRTLDFVNVVRQTNDPEELFAAATAFIENAQAKATAAPVPASPDAPAAPAPDVGLPEGDQGAPAQSVDSSAGRRESGVVGSIRGIFKDAGVATR